MRGPTQQGWGRRGEEEGIGELRAALLIPSGGPCLIQPRGPGWAASGPGPAGRPSRHPAGILSPLFMLAADARKPPLNIWPRVSGLGPGSLNLIPRYSPAVQSTARPLVGSIRVYCYSGGRRGRGRNQSPGEEARNQIHGPVETLPYA